MNCQVPFGIEIFIDVDSWRICTQCFHVHQHLPTGSVLHTWMCACLHTTFACNILYSNRLYDLITGWWFRISFIFTPIWKRFPFWLIFFKWVETTKQIIISYTTYPLYLSTSNFLIATRTAQGQLQGGSRMIGFAWLQQLGWCWINVNWYRVAYPIYPSLWWCLQTLLMLPNGDGFLSLFVALVFCCQWLHVDQKKSLTSLHHGLQMLCMCSCLNLCSIYVL